MARSTAFYQGRIVGFEHVFFTVPNAVARVKLRKHVAQLTRVLQARKTGLLHAFIFAMRRASAYRGAPGQISGSLGPWTDGSIAWFAGSMSRCWFGQALWRVSRTGRASCNASNSCDG